MADFCRQCAKDHGFPEGDLANITKEEWWNENKAVVVICEGCGVIQVDPEGNCVTDNCLNPGHKKNLFEVLSGMKTLDEKQAFKDDNWDEEQALLDGWDD